MEKDTSPPGSDGQVGQGPVPADGAGRTPPTAVESLREPLDWTILGHLEDVEQERINFGLYETFVSTNEILQRSREKDGDQAPQLEELEACLRRLRAHSWILTV